MNGNRDQIILFIQCKFIFEFILYNTSCISEIFRISHYGTASTDSAAYILGGGTITERTSIIAQFQNNKWQKIGDLKEVKTYPSAISHGGEYLIIGGSSKYATGRLVN